MDAKHAIVELIRTFQKDHGYPPSGREIMAGLSSGSSAEVARCPRELEAEGRIERDRFNVRAIRLKEADGRGSG